MTQASRPSEVGSGMPSPEALALAAHKLNTPVACIHGFVLTLLQRGDQLDAATRQEFLQTVLAQSTRLQVMLRDFLLLLRIQAGAAPVYAPVSPQAVFDDVCDQLGERAVRVRLTGDLRAQAITDATLVGAALRALVDNALTYGPRDEEVSVHVAIDASGSRWEVRDGGAWLSQEVLDRLFVPFQRAEEPVERRGEGAGLGLAVARAAMQAVGGQVGGSLERTTTFWLTVPHVDAGPASALVGEQSVSRRGDSGLWESSGA